MAARGVVAGVVAASAGAASRSAALALSSAATFFMVAESPGFLAVFAGAFLAAAFFVGAFFVAVFFVVFCVAMVFSLAGGARAPAHRGGQARAARFPARRRGGESQPPGM
ncbi:MAG: hypothetical protein HND58_17335 [Planctomycetota bacterium]|nr:MAG: hypothetical protein HND58_17335 [Planctomycetota bacterium]